MPTPMPPEPMDLPARIRDKLTAALAPAQLEIIDESGRHAGHAGTLPGGQTHFRILIVSEAFRGLNQVARQRAVYAALEEEWAGRLHALSIRALSPEEVNK